MLFLFNIIWVVFSGFFMFLAYMIFGGIACLTVVGTPFGLAAIRIADYALWPFGREIVRRPTAGVGSTLGNVVWIIVAGVWLAIGHAVSGVVLCLTIIGIPLGLAHFKLIPVSLTPLGREIVSTR